MRALVIVLLLVPVVGVAQPGLTQPTPEPAVRSEGLATVLALGGTIGGVWLFASGVRDWNDNMAYAGIGLAVVGPSAGHIYAGEGRHAVGTSLMRAGAVLLVFTALDAITDASECEDVVCDDHTPARLLLVGLAGYAAVALYDIFDAHGAVRRANQRSFVIAPSVATTPSGRAPIVSLGMRF